MIPPIPQRPNLRYASNLLPHRRQYPALRGILAPQFAHSRAARLELPPIIFSDLKITTIATRATNEDKSGKSKNTLIVAKLPGNGRRRTNNRGTRHHDTSMGRFS
jgi:hypothetical protein